MSRQKELFEKLHPEQFSDSIIVKKAELDRDFMDYYLEKISSRSQEKEFEQFCKKIAEAELCPNLITQTGPTGGGDSKVDTETYPVSETLSEMWYYGYGDKAGTERWAFAVSAKQEWSGKVKSDVEKIIKVNKDCERGYTKIFFLSNQYISDKKRADKEDELRKLSGMDVRILDKNWLLDKIFAKDSNKKITVECFNLSEKLLDEKEIGERDYARQNELKAIEEKLSKPSELKPAEIVSLADESVRLNRQLECSEQEILGLLDRYKRLTNEYGNSNDMIECIYQCAWTIYWWYTNADRFYEFYLQLEDIAFKEKNILAFEKITILWLNLNALVMEGFDIDLQKHTKKIVEQYQCFLEDSNKPNTILRARNTYQLMRFFLGDSIDDIVNDYIDIINKGIGSLEFDLYPISRIIQENSYYEDAKKYDELFELVIERMGEQNKDAEVGRMLVKRGQTLKDKKPYEAIAYYSRTLRRFYNEANKEHLATVILEMGELFEKVGLFWAARNYYLYDFCLCLNRYMKDGEITPVLMISAYKMKYIELKLGRIMYSAEFNQLEQIARHIYPSELNEQNDDYDYILAIQIFRTKFENLKEIGKLDGYLEERGLFFSQIALKYKFGYYDEGLLEQLNGDKDIYDDYVEKWKNQPALNDLKVEPWYGIEEKIHMKSRVLGCLFSVEAANDGFTMEFASSLLATIECFFGTGVNNKLISMVGKIDIAVMLVKNEFFNVEVKKDGKIPTSIVVEISKYRSDEYIGAQKLLHEKMFELIAQIIMIMFPYKSEFEKIKKMEEDEEVIVRTDIFANSTFIGIETLGEKGFLFTELTDKYEALLLEKEDDNEDMTIVDEKEEISNEQIKFDIKYEQPPEKEEFLSTSNENIVTSNTINIPLWNSSGWKGVFFLTASGNLPILAPLFSSQIGFEIFNEWIKEFGTDDISDKIGIRIVKGINKKHPSWYRVIIGDQKFPKVQHENTAMVVLPTRLHTMEAESLVNLERFEKNLAIKKDYYFCPAIMNNGEPKVDFSKLIKKHANSIKICNAWEMEEDALFEIGIMPNDNPVIPEGYESAHILKVIDMKKKYV